MYHVVEYIKTAGSIRKEKCKSPEPPNEVSRLILKGFDNWKLRRPWSYMLHNFKGIGKRGVK